MEMETDTEQQQMQNGYDRMALFASSATTTAFLLAAADAQNMYSTAPAPSYLSLMFMQNIFLLHFLS